jgi:hypothetical protein
MYLGINVTNGSLPHKSSLSSIEGGEDDFKHCSKLSCCFRKSSSTYNKIFVGYYKRALSDRQMVGEEVEMARELRSGPSGTPPTFLRTHTSLVVPVH